MIEHNRSFALKGYGRLGKCTAMQFRPGTKGDSRSSHNGASNMTAGPKGGGSAKNPDNVLRFGTVLQVKIGIRSSNQSAASNEDKLGISFVVTIESDHSAIRKVDGTA